MERTHQGHEKLNAFYDQFVFFLTPRLPALRRRCNGWKVNDVEIGSARVEIRAAGATYLVSTKGYYQLRRWKEDQ